MKRKLTGFSLVMAACLAMAPWVSADGVFTPNLTQETFAEGSSFAVPGNASPNTDVLRIRQGGGTWKTGISETKTDAHYVISYETPTKMGTVMLYGSWRVSYLKPGIENLNPQDESQWTAASYPGQADRNLRAVPLPTGVKTSAIRLSGTTWPDQAGNFQADLLFATSFEARFVNVAPLAKILVSSSGPASTGFQPDPRQNNPLSLNDGIVRHRNWSSGDREEPLSRENSEWIMLDWTQPRTLRGCALFSGIWENPAAEIIVQKYTGTGRPFPEKDADWETIATVTPDTARTAMFRETYCDFGMPVETRALRLVAMQGRDDSKTKFALGEVMVFEHLGEQPAPTDLAAEQIPEGVVPITFTMPQAGKATIQIVDENGKTVRNIVSGREFPAGEHTIWWDLSTLYDYWPPFGKPNMHSSGIEDDPRAMATPGAYRWRGLWHPGLELEYLYSYYPLKKHNLAWITADNTGGWLADHVPPQSVVRTGDTMWCGTFCEAGQAILEANLDMKKLWGSGRIWLACPRVMAADGDYVYYVEQGGWTRNRIVMIQIDIHSKRSRRIMVREYESPDTGYGPRATAWDVQGLAVSGETAYLANRKRDKVLQIDLSKNLAGPWRGFSWQGVGEIFENEDMTVVKEIDVEKPGRIRLYGDDKLAAVSGDKVVLIDRNDYSVVPVVTGLTNPLGLGTDAEGNFYVGEMDPAHQVKVFAADGNLIRTLGKPGKHVVGPFDPNNLESPAGVEVDANGNVWVCEFNNDLKRTSVWNEHGECINHVVGPPTYGGGGTIDPADANRTFYRAKEFRRDPGTGRVEMTHILFRGDDRTYPDFGSYPSYAFQKDGKLYFTSWQGWGHGARTTLWVRDDKLERVRPVAAIGTIPGWLKERLGQDKFFTGKITERVDGPIDFNWPEAPAEGVPADDFAVRWTGKLLVPRDGVYTFFLHGDDGHRLKINGRDVVGKWPGVHSPDNSQQELKEGSHDIIVELQENRHRAAIKLEWQGPEIERQVIPASALRTSEGDDAKPGLLGEYYRSDPEAEDAIFAWTDLNDDGEIQDNEVRTGKITYDDKQWDKVGATWQWRMNQNFEAAASDGNYGSAGIAFFHVERLTPQGYPVYALPTKFHLFPDGRHASDAVFTDRNGNAISMDVYLFSMAPSGEVNWMYKSRWPGLHAGHHTTATGAEPGVLIAPTRYLGAGVVNDEIGEVICVGSNLGSTHLFTEDGLYVDRVFEDCRQGLAWRMNTPPSPEVLSKMSLGDEHFGGTFQRTTRPDGSASFRYVVGQPHCSVIELQGLENVKRLNGGTFTVTAEAFDQAELLRQQRALQKAEPKYYVVPKIANVVIDGRADEWPQERIDGFALAWDSENLYVYFEGVDRHAVFQNAAGEDSFLEVFKLGDVVDVMLQTNPNVDPDRTNGAEGDIRLSFAPLGEKPMAILYDYVVPGTAKGDRFPFSSPWRTLYIDSVSILDNAKIAVNRERDRFSLEAAVPLSAIGLDPARTPVTRGDVGRVLSDQTGTRAVNRVYWSNKNTNIVSDVPSEARVQPNLWGTFAFQKE